MIGVREYPMFFDESVFDTMAWYQSENPECTKREAWRFAESFHRGIAYREMKQKEWVKTYGHLLPTYGSDE